MDAIDLTMKLMRTADEPHCKAELQKERPIQHWKTHCVNCGSHMTKPHRRNDCPTQNYEKSAHTNQNTIKQEDGGKL